MPRIIERFDLRRRFFTSALFEQDVVVLSGIEGRVQVDEINVFIGSFFPKNFQIVTEIEPALPGVLNRFGERRALPSIGERMTGHPRSRATRVPTWQS